jgi:hypothetical protein
MGRAKTVARSSLDAVDRLEEGGDMSNGRIAYLLGRWSNCFAERRRYAAYAAAPFLRPPAARRESHRMRWKRWSLLLAGLALLTLSPLLAYSGGQTSGCVVAKGTRCASGRLPAQSRTTSLRESTVSATASLRK